MNKSLISIIVPVYNAEKHLSRCIDSIINQTYTNLEILLINDGSTDNSGKICENYRLIDNRIKVFHLSNGGVSKARNFGFQNVKGEYVGFVDSDDWVDQNMYETLFQNLIEHNADISACEIYYEYRNKTILNKKKYDKEILLSKGELYDAVLDPNYFCGYVCNKLFKKPFMDKVVRNNQLFRERIHYCEDLLFVSQYISKSLTAVYTPTPLYHYLQSEDNATSNYKLNPKIFSLIEAYENLIELYATERPTQLNRLKLNYTKINLNIKYRVLTSKDDILLLIDLDKNIKKYIRDVKNANDIGISQKINVLISYILPKLSGDIKLFFKKYIVSGN